MEKPVEANMNPLHKQMLDDVFDAFSMLSPGNLVSATRIGSGVTRWSPAAAELFGLPGEYAANGCAGLKDYIHPEDRKRFMDTLAPLARDAPAWRAVCWSTRA